MNGILILQNSIPRDQSLPGAALLKEQLWQTTLVFLTKKNMSG